MTVWGKSPWRFFVLSSVGGILFGYALFKLILRLPEGISMGLGMIALWPIAMAWELSWRKRSSIGPMDGKAASIYGIPTWIVSAILALVWTLLFALSEI